MELSKELLKQINDLPLSQEQQDTINRAIQDIQNWELYNLSNIHYTINILDEHNINTNVLNYYLTQVARIRSAQSEILELDNEFKDILWNWLDWLKSMEI